jgi:uncharacterized protein YgiM (DUF1202 family)
MILRSRNTGLFLSQGWKVVAEALAGVVVCSLVAACALDRTGVVTTEGVNMRTAPNRSTRVIAKLKKGEKVQIIENVGKWYRVRRIDESKKDL